MIGFPGRLGEGSRLSVFGWWVVIGDCMGSGDVLFFSNGKCPQY